jgi:cell division protein FtsB|tara:strand:+ start:146 stop:313 length:168 start_codon:yes stop_codon:yes gene_type:complete
MKDLISFKNAQIEALQREVDLLKKSNTQLETYVFELTDEDVPKEYKSVVRQEILK